VLFNTILPRETLAKFMLETKMILNIPEGGLSPMGNITTDGRTCISYPINTGEVPDRIWG